MIANSSDEITLKGVDISYGRGGNVDNAPVVATEDNAVLNPVSTTNPTIRITGIFDRTVTADMNKIILLDTMTRSKGIKLLYYNSTDADISEGSATDGWNNVISEIGAENLDGGTNQRGDIIVDVHTQSGGELYNSNDPFPHLHIYVKQLSVTQVPNSRKLRFVLSCEVT